MDNLGPFIIIWIIICVIYLMKKMIHGHPDISSDYWSFNKVKENGDSINVSVSVATAVLTLLEHILIPFCYVFLTWKHQQKNMIGILLFIAYPKRLKNMSWVQRFIAQKSKFTSKSFNFNNENIYTFDFIIQSIIAPS